MNKNKNNESLNTEDEAGRGPGTRPSEGCGQYIEGDYGRAGIKAAHLPEEEAGQYVEGNYGRAGIEPGRHEHPGIHQGEGDGYVTADYGQAGTTHPSAQAHAGTYIDSEHESSAVHNSRHRITPARGRAAR